MFVSTRRRCRSECAGVRPHLVGLGLVFSSEASPVIQSSTSSVVQLESQPLSSFASTSTTYRHDSSPPASRATSASSSGFGPFTMRSSKGMEGLRDAELGGSMVELDPYGGGNGSGFRAGQKIGPAASTTTSSLALRQRSKSMSHTTASLSRSGTIFSNDASHSRKAAELKALLGNSTRRVSARASIPLPSPPDSAPSTERPASRHRKSVSTSDIPTSMALEKAKSKARVEVDIELESDMVVEGGYLRGRIEISIRKPHKNESPVWIDGGKMRIVGFEGLPNSDTRYTFYSFAEALSTITASLHGLYQSQPDEEGFRRANEGVFTYPFAMKLPIRGPGGTPKGSLLSKSGASIRYIVMGSVKIRDPKSLNRSIAHFYRHVDIYPFYGRSVLAAAEQPLQTSTGQTLFMGGSGKLTVTAALHRRVWIAGQRCYVHVVVDNRTSKKVKTLSFSLLRTTTMFQPRTELDALADKSPNSVDPDSCETSTSRREVARSTLEMGQKGEKGCVTAKGFWTGVDGGSVVELSHWILVPPDALSIPRGRLVEVDYVLRVSASAGSLSSDVTVSLPIRVINFLSLDPPPTYPLSEQNCSVSLRNLKDHEKQLKDWEGRYNEPSRISPQRPVAGLPQTQSESQIVSSRGSPVRQAVPQSSPTRSQVSMPSPASRPSTPSVHPSPTRAQARAHILAPTSSRSTPPPTRSILTTSPTRGRDMARDMFNRPNMARSKTVAFAEEHRDRSNTFPRGMPQRTPAPLNWGPPPMAPPPVPRTKSVPVPIPTQVASFLAPPAVKYVPSPAAMTATSSAVADDERESESDGGSKYTDEKYTARQPVLHTDDELSEIETEIRSGSPILSAPMAVADMSKDGRWEDAEMDTPVIRRTKRPDVLDSSIKLSFPSQDEECLLHTTLPRPELHDASASDAVTPRVPSPTKTSSQAQVTLKDRLEDRRKVPQPLGRSHSALAFHEIRSPYQARLAGHAKAFVRPGTSISLDGGEETPRLGHGSSTYAVPRALPFPPVSFTVGPTGAEHSEAVIHAKPRRQLPHPLATPFSTKTSPPAQTLSPPVEMEMRPNHAHRQSASSVSTESSLHTDVSSSSSSTKGMPPSLKSKITQMEARNRTLRAFSTFPIHPREAQEDSLMKKTKSALVAGHQRYASYPTTLELGGGVSLEDLTSISSSGSRYSGEISKLKMVDDPTEFAAFNSPLFQKATPPSEWAAKLKK